MAQWLSWLERRPVTAKVVGSSPIWVVNGVLAQLGEHLPYKQRVIGSSPIGPISFEDRRCRCGSILDDSQELTSVGRAADYKSAAGVIRRCGSIGRAADL